MNDSVNITHEFSQDHLFPWHLSTWNNFKKARNNNHLPHAILLNGEEGIGKLKLAERMAKSLLCMNTTANSSDACNQCPSCKTYESAANPDYLQIGLLEEKKQISVDQIRSLSEFLNYSRSYNTYRVVIINPVERMNLNAANSLLKSLEEPTPNTIIILVTANHSSLLATIKSRCQLFSVNSPSKDETITWLEQNKSTEINQQLDAMALFNMVGAKPLNALSISQEDIDNKTDFYKDIHSVIKQSISISDIAKKWEKHDIETMINWQIQAIQSAIKISFDSNLVTVEEGVSLLELSKHLDSDEKWHLYQSLIKQKQYIHTSVNPLMFLENMIMLWTKASN